MSNPTEANILEGYEQLNNINITIILAFTTLYIFRRSYASTTPAINVVKGRLKTFGAWMLKFALLFELGFSCCITYISRDHNIKRSEVELFRVFNDILLASYKDYTIDIVAVMIFSLKIAEILLISSIYFLVALSVPNPSHINEETYSSHNLSSSIGRWATLWAIFRIPVFLYVDAYKSLFDQKLTIFIFELAAALEYIVAGFLLLILASRHHILRSIKSLESMVLLSVSLLLFGIFKHAVNLVDLPFILTPLHTQALSSIQLALQMSIYLLVADILCPYKKMEENGAVPVEEANDKNTNRQDLCKTEVMLVPSMIEFDERLFRN